MILVAILEAGQIRHANLPQDVAIVISSYEREIFLRMSLKMQDLSLRRSR